MTNAPPSSRPSGPPGADDSASAASPSGRLFWLCMAIGLVAVAALAWQLGLSWWIAIVVALAIACPAAAAWILVGRYDDWPELPGVKR